MITSYACKSAARNGKASVDCSGSCCQAACMRRLPGAGGCSGGSLSSEHRSLCDCALRSAVAPESASTPVISAHLPFHLSAAKDSTSSSRSHARVTARAHLAAAARDVGDDEGADLLQLVADRVLQLLGADHVVCLTWELVAVALDRGRGQLGGRREGDADVVMMICACAINNQICDSFFSPCGATEQLQLEVDQDLVLLKQEPISHVDVCTRQRTTCSAVVISRRDRSDRWATAM